MASEREITDVIAVLSGIYSKEPGDLRGYYWTLGEIDCDLLERAAQDWVKHNKWLPQPSELLDLAEKMQNKRNLWHRMNSAFNAIASGKEKDERIVNAVFDYYRVGVRPDIPSKPDTRTDAEIEAEWQAWNRDGRPNYNR